MFTNTVFKASTAVHFRYVCPVSDKKRQLHVHDNLCQARLHVPHRSYSGLYGMT